MVTHDPDCIVQVDMLPRVIGYRFLREWIVLAEEFVNERKDWKNKTLAAMLGCTLEGEVHEHFRSMTNEGEVEDWSKIWSKMLEILENNNKSSFAYMNKKNTVCEICFDQFDNVDYLKRHMQSAHPQQLECPHCDKKFESPDALAQHLTFHQDIREEPLELEEEQHLRKQIEEENQRSVEEDETGNWVGNFNGSTAQSRGADQNGNDSRDDDDDDDEDDETNNDDNKRMRLE